MSAEAALTQVGQPVRQSSFFLHRLANLCYYPIDENMQVGQLEWAPLRRPHGRCWLLETRLLHEEHSSGGQVVHRPLQQWIVLVEGEAEYQRAFWQVGRHFLYELGQLCVTWAHHRKFVHQPCATFLHRPQYHACWSKATNNKRKTAVNI